MGFNYSTNQPDTYYLLSVLCQKTWMVWEVVWVLWRIVWEFLTEHVHLLLGRAGSKCSDQPVTLRMSYQFAFKCRVIMTSVLYPKCIFLKSKRKTLSVCFFLNNAKATEHTTMKFCKTIGRPLTWTVPDTLQGWLGSGLGMRNTVFSPKTIF